MIAFYRKYWRTAFDIALLILTAYLIMYTFSYLYSIAAPIFLAFIVFMFIEPLAAFLHRRGMRKAIASAISVLLFVLVILGAMFGLGFILVHQAIELQDKLPTYIKAVQSELVNIATYLQNRYESLPPDVSGRINEYAGNAAQHISEFIVGLLSLLIKQITSFSTFTLNFAIAIILGYFLSIEIDTWRRVARNKTPRTFLKAYIFLKENVLKGLSAYLKAQLKLISVTFVIVFIGLLVLGVSNSFLVALLSAIFDLLPLLGIPFIFIPWIAYLFIIGNTSLAIGLAVVMGVTLLIRQILDPKITGTSLGVSAFTMLSFMIVSMSLFGVIGIVMSTVLLILIKALYDQGYLKRWIRMPKEEFVSGHPFDNTSPDQNEDNKDNGEPKNK
ncbi:sporulation integral membrane protein YtvI [Paenibacillaceae sp. P-4]|uniref:sporulation integral membrane protein YtvI n=1 Tax=Paenibacillaceae bacterium P-4 TaxID=3160969 RepID=UPI0015809D88